MVIKKFLRYLLLQKNYSIVDWLLCNIYTEQNNREVVYKWAMQNNNQELLGIIGKYFNISQVYNELKRKEFNKINTDMTHKRSHFLMEQG